MNTTPGDEKRQKMRESLIEARTRLAKVKSLNAGTPVLSKHSYIDAKVDTAFMLIEEALSAIAD